MGIASYKAEIDPESDSSAINETHGGDLELAAKTYGVPLAQWLDLSTGIAPWCYPDLTVPDAVWQRLPHGEAELLQAAAVYYNLPVDFLKDQHSLAKHIVTVAGSQQAIVAIPRLLTAPCRVAIPELGYFEHRHAWQAAGHRVVPYKDAELRELIANGEVDVAVVINPNNPTSYQWSADELLGLREQLHTRGGMLLVDEAFADFYPHNSVAAHCNKPGLLVLRSIGKFFGLAGLRLGFVMGDADWCRRLQQQLGSWNVSGPAQWLGQRLLQDNRWQQQQRQRIEWRCEQLREGLHRCFGADADIVAAGLFVRVVCDAELGQRVYAGLAQRGILIRRFELPKQRYCLRFGLPVDDRQQHDLVRALKEIMGD